MNGIVRSLLFVTAIGLLAVVLICASDDSEAEQVEVVFGDGIAVTYQDRSGGTPPYPQYMIYDSPSLIDDSYYITAAPMEMEYGNIFLNGVDVGPGNQFFRISDYPDGIHFEVFRSDYSVVFGRNGGEGETQTSIINLENGDNFTIPDVLYTRLGYRSVQWNTREDGTGEVISPGNYTMDLDFIRNHYSLSNNDLVLYPGWVAVNYSINYNLNNGIGQPPPNNIKTIGMGVTIPSINMTRTGYSATIWNMSPDGTGLDINIGDKVLDTSFLTTYFGNETEITLYPKWTKNTYSIRYSSTEEMEGVLPETMNYIIGQTINIPISAITRAGYALNGWNTSADMSGLDIQFGDHSVDTAFLERYYGPSDRNLILYPKWIPVDYSITLSSEFGSASDVGWSVTDGKLSRGYNIESEMISLPTPEPDDRFHLFVNWEDSAGNSVSRIATGTVGNIELKAAWIEKSYPITARINGKEVTFDLTLSSEMPYAEPEDGFAFKGWYYRDDEGNEVKFESMSQMAENMEIYAVFEPTQDDPLEIAACVIGIVVFFTVVIGYGFTRE